MKISLRERTEKHVIEFYNKTQTKEIEALFPLTVKSEEEAIRLFHASQKENATSYGKVIYAEEGYVGDVWCYGIDLVDEKMAMLSIVIFNSDFWGKGIGKQALQKFIEEVFEKYPIEKIGAFTYSHNSASIGSLKKVGFSEIEAFVEDGIESKYFEYLR